MRDASARCEARGAAGADGQVAAPDPSHPALRAPHCFPPALRLRTRADFAGCYDAKVKRSRGPLLVFARRNGLGHPRLGTSVSRKVGNAVRRHAIKRRLREAFRLHQHDLPPSLDLLVVVRPHEPMTVAEYADALSSLAADLDRAWTRRTVSSHADPTTTGVATSVAT